MSSATARRTPCGFSISEPAAVRRSPGPLRAPNQAPVEVVHMLMWMVLTLAVAAAPQAPAVQAPSEPRAQAEQLARSGSYRAALERFQAIAAKNPDDLEARVWIARLHSLMGDDRRAVDVYESIIATHPKHVDALVGLGDALVRLGRLREAADTLN